MTDTAAAEDGALFERAIEGLSLGEAAELERHSEIPIDEMTAPGKPKMLVIIGLVTVLRRRDEPGFTFDQAAEIKLSDLESELAGLVPEDPTGGGPG